VPYVSNMQDEEQKTDQAITPQGAVAPTGSGAGPVRLSPSSSVPTVGGGGTSGAGSVAGGAPTPSSGGQFASLNQYLTANQGQAAPLAGKLTPSINQEYNNLDTQNNAAIANINNQVTNAPGYTPSNPSLMSAEAANPASFTSDPNNIKQFQSLLQNSYAGPTSAESTPDYANQQNAINNAIAAGTSQTTTEAGRENLLSQNEATPTAGVTALNTAILSQDPNALSSIENAYKPFNNLITNLQTGAQSADTAISKEQADAAASSKAANDAINSQITALNTGVSGALTAAQQKAATQNAQVRADIAAGTPSATDLQALGVSADQWNALSAAQKAAATSEMVKSNQGQYSAQSGTANVDLTNFLTQQDPNAVINAANVATPEDYAKAQAFQTLLQGMNLNAPTALINPATTAQAGTAPSNLNQYDYQTALNTANTTKADEVAAAQAYVDALQAGSDEEHAQLVAAQAARQSMEQKLEAVGNTTLGLPVAVASQMPVIGKPIANAVDTVTHFVSNATWICTAMRRHGVMTQEEIDQLHDHLYLALPYKPWSFLKYLILGKPLVMLANMVDTEWGDWKPLFFDIPMAEKNPVEAVKLYEMAFWNLFRVVKWALCQKYKGHPAYD
jgi:hypothetical protein